MTGLFLNSHPSAAPSHPPLVRKEVRQNRPVESFPLCQKKHTSRGLRAKETQSDGLRLRPDMYPLSSKNTS